VIRIVGLIIVGEMDEEMELFVNRVGTEIHSVGIGVVTSGSRSGSMVNFHISGSRSLML
jgi:hypothetical protein